MCPKIRFALLVASVALLPCAPVLAADLEQTIPVDQAPDEYQPVEVGSGWYLRGDVGYQANSAFDHDRHLNRDYGVVDWDVDSSQQNYTVGAGVGYHFTDWLRADINAGYIPGSHASVDYDDGSNVEHGKLSNKAWYGMANVYADLGTYVGLTPYVGAGIGFLTNQLKAKADYDDGGFKRDYEKDNRDTALAYSLAAGVAYRFTDNLSVDLGYQYVTSPDVKYVDVTDLDHYPTRKGLDFHQFRIGLRYDLW